MATSGTSRRSRSGDTRVQASESTPLSRRLEASECQKSECIRLLSRSHGRAARLGQAERRRSTRSFGDNRAYIFRVLSCCGGAARGSVTRTAGTRCLGFKIPLREGEEGVSPSYSPSLALLPSLPPSLPPSSPSLSCPSHSSAGWRGTVRVQRAEKRSEIRADPSPSIRIHSIRGAMRNILYNYIVTKL